MFYSDITEASEMAAEMSRTTHGSEECKDACRVLSVYIRRALNGLSKKDVLAHDERFVNNLSVDAIANGSYEIKTKEQIRASGFVLHTLEAALWSFFTTDNFRDGAIKAVNLCEDADTTGAVYGQLAGAYYGLSGIPSGWVSKIAFGQDILNIATKLFTK
jgi:ADP-ribosyl-[dinitrogen reductase] hydrolase